MPKLSTSHICIHCCPSITAHCSPYSIYAHFHSSFQGRCSTNKSYCTMSASCKGNFFIINEVNEWKHKVMQFLCSTQWTTASHAVVMSALKGSSFWPSVANIINCNINDATINRALIIIKFNTVHTVTATAFSTLAKVIMFTVDCHSTDDMYKLNLTAIV